MMKFSIVAAIAVCSLCATVSAQCDTDAFITCSTNYTDAVSDATDGNDIIFSTDMSDLALV